MKFEKLMKDLGNCESEEQIKEVIDNVFEGDTLMLMKILLSMLRKRDDIVFIDRNLAYYEDDQDLIKDIIVKFFSNPLERL